MNANQELVVMVKIDESSVADMPQPIVAAVNELMRAAEGLPINYSEYLLKNGARKHIVASVYLVDGAIDAGPDVLECDLRND